MQMVVPMTKKLSYIEKACLEIAYDNGMVNRHHTESEVLEDMMGRINRKFSFQQIREVEEELSALDHYDFLLVVLGDLDKTVEVSPLIYDLLNIAFEGNDYD